jgi:hypothetical protein
VHPLVKHRLEEIPAPHSRQEIIPTTEQATSPLRRPMTKDLTIRTIVANPCKVTTTFNVTRCAKIIASKTTSSRLESSMTSLGPLHRCGPHNSKVVACDIFSTPNSLTSHLARNLKSPFSNIHAVPFKLYPHTRLPAPSSSPFKRPSLLTSAVACPRSFNSHSKRAGTAQYVLFTAVSSLGGFQTPAAVGVGMFVTAGVWKPSQSRPFALVDLHASLNLTSRHSPRQ